MRKQANLCYSALAQTALEKLMAEGICGMRSAFNVSDILLDERSFHRGKAERPLLLARNGANPLRRVFSLILLGFMNCCR